MNTRKLYHALVVVGALLVTGCAKQAAPAVKKADKCLRVCHLEGEAVFCPDPQWLRKGDTQKNCCWLMAAGKHPCCATLAPAGGS